MISSDLRVSTLASLLRFRAAERPAREAFVFLTDGETEGDRLTYAELDRRARAVAAALRESLAPGDRALLLYPPGLEFIVAFFGCLYAGVIAVPAYPPRPNDRSQARLRSIVRDARPAAALSTAAISAEAPPELAGIRWIPTDGLVDAEADLPGPSPDSVAFLQYTSGSTASPKGVMVTHANLLHNERMIGEAFGQDEDSVVVGWLPLYHDMGLIGNVLQPVHAGARCVLMSPVAFLQRPLRWLEAIDRYRGTTSGGPNFAYELCVRRIGAEERARLDLSSWQVAFNGAEPVRAQTLERFAEAFAPSGFRREAFHPCYGLAEATLFVTGGLAGRAPRVESAEPGGRPLVSCGRVWGGQRIAVADPETGVELPPGREGEIWIAGPSVAAGYWGNPEATERDFQARLAGTGEGPFLRTGDLGLLRGGELYVTGRLKDLIILRGRNHYPQDVELTAEQSHTDLRPGGGAAFSVEVSGEERLVVVQEVERHRRTGFEELAEAIRRAVAEEHEAQVHEVVLVRVGGVPKTSSGKVQRRLCRERYLAGELPVLGRSALAEETAPAPVALPGREALLALEPGERRAVLERSLRERAAAAVGAPAEAIGADQPLTALGLDSLAAVELKGAVEPALGVELPLAELLGGAGTGRLAELLLAGLEEERTGAPAVPPGEHDGRLSYGQRALWFLERLAPQGAYNIAVAARVRGGLDAAALRRALEALVERHAALRTVFPLEGDEPVRRVLERGTIDFAEEPETWDGERLAGEAYRPFDLEHGPLLRVRVLGNVLLLSVHHIAADFASLAILARELGVLYRGEALPLPAAGDADFVRWQEGVLATRGERLWDYWRETLAGVPDLDLPVDRPRPPVQTWRGTARFLELPPALADGVRALGAARGATLFMTLLAAFQAQLGRSSHQRDFAVGSPTAGRSAPEHAGIVGYLVSPVALRADLAGDPSSSELLDRVRRTALGALAHADFPFALAAERLRPERDPARSPIFQTMLVLQRLRAGDPPGLALFALGEAGGRLDLGGLELESLRLEEQRAQLDLTLRAAELPSGGLGLSLEVNADLFDAATAGRMLGHLRTLLEGAVADPRVPVPSLPLLTAPERRQILGDWGTGPAAAAPELLHRRFEEQAERTPEATALVAGTESLTYAELNRRANRLARHLRSLGVGPEVRVGVRLGRSADLVVSLLAVLKAGGAYLPLDPSYPAERLELMVEDSGAALVLSAPWDEGSLTAWDGSNLAPVAVPENLAYLIYTSGSTGRPKAVAIEHRSASVLVAWARRVFSPEELAGVLASTSIGFDLSVFELFVPLSWGGRVILAENALELPRLPAAGEVTLVNTVPSALAELVRGGGLPPSVRTVNLAGEPVPPALVDAVCALPGVERLYNLYGPSEDTTYSTAARLTAGSAVTIGRPIDGTRACLLDAGMEPVPAGVPGELCLAGAGLARGYLGRPELTAERFVPDPFGEEPGARLYRTGDLARWRPDGTIDFLGRLDHQVKVRGFRIELGEIEAALARHPQVREAVVTAREEGEGGKRLVAYVVPRDGELPAAALRAFLGRTLPEFMIPSAFVLLGALPLSPNGKVDRKALPAPEPAAAGAPSEGPSTPLEELLAGVFAEVLGVERVGLREDFFERGGHSLLAARAASRVSRLLGIDLPVSALFQAPAVADLAARLGEAAPAGPSLRPVPRDGRGLPVSFAQRRLWFLDRLEPGTAAYNLPGGVLLEGPLDVPALAASLSGVVDRHEALRTVFHEEDGEPVQVVVERSLDLPVVDLSGLPRSRREAEAGWLAGSEARAPFDLERGPVCRARLVRVSGQEHLLLVTLHHIAADGWSLGIFLRELAIFYEALAARRPAALPALPVQSGDYAVWQREWLRCAALEGQLAYWRGRLAGLPVLELPADRPRPATRDLRGGVRSVTLPPELAAEVERLARREGATLFMALLGVFQAVLARWTGEDAIPVGSPVANRRQVEIEGLIGFFVNTLVLDARVDDDPPFRGLLERVREACLGAYAHQDVPFELLVEELQPHRDLAQNPLFQVMLTLEEPLPALRAGGLSLAPRRIENGTAKFDLTLAVSPQPDGGWRAGAESAAALFDPGTMDRLLGHFRTLLEGAVVDPSRRLSDLPLLAPAEREQILGAWNEIRLDFPRGLCLHDLVAAQAARTPDAEAVLAGSEALTYGELARRANQLARHLRALGIGPEVRVGVRLGRTADLVIAILAVLEAGGTYVPIDPKYPRERQDLMLEDSGARLVISPEVIAAAEGCDGADLPPAARPGNLAYLIYTSGSTGRPKAVAIEHRSAVALVQWALTVYSPEDLSGVLFATSVCFDLSVFEMFVPLAVGGRVIVAKDALELPRMAAAERVTLVNTVPSAMAELARGSLPAGLRVVNLAGEPLQEDLVRRIYAHPQVERVYNLYGPSEDTTYSTFTLVPRGEPVTIGRPLAGTQAWVVGRSGELLPAGVPGELWLGGEGLARGYLGRPELTAERFVPDPFGGEAGARLYRTGDLVRRRPDGELLFLGRIDHQVKIRGFRIELGEVEAALASHPAVREAAVLAVPEPAGEGRRLAAFVVPAEGVELERGALRSWLRERLPEAFVPTAWAMLPALPLSPNGKVDRRALARMELAPGRQEAAMVEPRTPVEKALAREMAALLGRERVGIHDDFFALGGHSLLATRLASRLSRAFGIELPVSAVFQEPTVAGLAGRIAGAAASEAPPLRPLPGPREGREDLPLSFAQQRLWFLDRLQPGTAAYNMPGAVHLTGLVDVPALAVALGGVQRRHEILRTVLPVRGGEPVQLVEPAKPVPLPVIDLGALPEEVREGEAERLAMEEGRTPFDLGRGPLWRARLLRLATGEHRLVVNLHHTIADGWSLGLLLREAAGLYAGGGEPLPELPVQYADYAVWQRAWLRGEALERQLAWWRDLLADLPVLDLPVDRPRPAVRDLRGAVRSLEIPPGLAGEIERLARSEGATLFMALLAAFQVLLARATGEGVVPVGSPVANRRPVEVEPLIGFFVNTLVLPVDLGEDPPFRDLLARVREVCLGAYARTDLPFERLVEELRPGRDLARNPLFQVLFQVEEPLPSLRAGDVAFAARRIDNGTAKLDLSLAVVPWPEGGWLVRAEYAAALFDSGTIDRLLEHWRTLLSAAVSAPEARLGELPSFDAAVGEQVLRERRAAREIEPLVRRDGPSRRPATPVEERLTELWSEVLGVEQVGVDDDFFDLGGHSLLAVRLSFRIAEALGVEVPVSVLFQSPTVALLARWLESGEARPAGPTPEPPGAGADGAFPLSLPQQRLWLLERLDPGNPAYNQPVAVRLTGDLREDCLTWGLGEILRRHEPLRTVFQEVEGEPVQAVQPPPPGALLPRLDLSALPEPGREPALRREIRAELARPFDLERGPMARFLLARLGTAEHVLVATFHHIASDGWSTEVFFRELVALYGAAASGLPSPLPELPLRYVDFALWQRRTLTPEVLEGQLAYWRRELEGVPVLELPTDRPRPARSSYRGGIVTAGFPPALIDRLRAFGRGEGITLFASLLAGFTALMARYSGQDDLPVGITSAGRNRRETEGMIGFFVNTLVIRTRAADDPGFRSLARQVRERILAAQANQDVPFERVVEELQPDRGPSLSPLFQVMLSHLSTSRAPLATPGLEAVLLDPEVVTAKFDLLLTVDENEGGVGGHLEHRTDLFEAATAARLLRHLVTLLEGATADPSRRLWDLPLLTAAEREQLLFSWNDTGADLPAGLCLHDLVAAQAARTPGADAVVGRKTRLTYEDLERRSNRLARHLRALGVGPEVRVGIRLGRTVDLVVSILAVLKAGGAYVPIDPKYPHERQELMLRDSGARVLIGAGEGAPKVVDLKRDREVLDGYEDSAPGPLAAPESLAYLIYTSGSTGRPKAVAIEHRSAVTLVQWALGVFSREDLRGVLFATSVCFDLSVFEMFVPLAVGGRVVVAEDALELRRLAASHEVTLVNTVPSAMAELARGTLPASLRVVNLAGEPLQPELVARIYAHPQVERVYNLYGPSEDTTYSTFTLVRRGEPVTIGRPIADTRAYVVDRRDRLAPVGVPGELWLGGNGLARGYLGRPELTAEKFVPDPFSGEAGARLYRTGDLVRWRADARLQFLGRIDHQVKVRGFRIELGEIESALVRDPRVGEAAVVVHEGSADPVDRRLVAYLVPRRAEAAAPAAYTAEEVTRHVGQWQGIWDDSYARGSRSGDEPGAGFDPTFDIQGWNSSYTGELIPAAEMHEWVDRTVERLLALPHRRVLEVGCGTGLLLFRVAPHADLYRATDFSATVLDRVRRFLGRDLPQVELERRIAGDWGGIEPGSLDLVILSSVAQYFPGTDYLARVLEGAVGAVAPGGAVFVGDVRSLPLLEALHLSVALHQAPGSMSLAELRQRVGRRVADEEELVVEPAFFFALARHLPGVHRVQVLLKRGSFANELTRFRYDVVLHVGAGEDLPGVHPHRLDWRTEGLSLLDLEHRLAAGHHDAFLLVGVPNARLATEAVALELLADLPFGTVADLRREIAGRLEAARAVDPEELERLADRFGYDAELSWSRRNGIDGLFTALLRRRDAAPVANPFPDLLAAGRIDRPWSAYGNDPMRKEPAHDFLPDLRRNLEAELPDYMIPSTFVLLEALPLTPNGKVDRRALARLTPDRGSREEYVAPRTLLEETLVKLWEEVLGEERTGGQVGVHDNFFDLGGHSLIASRLSAHVRSALGIELPLRALFEAPTVAGLAQRLEGLHGGWVEAIPRQPRRPGEVARFPVSFSQLREWILDRLEPGTPAYNIPSPKRIAGPASVPAFAKALREIVRRHESLRTTFEAGREEPLQVVAPDLDVPLPVIDLDGLPEERREPELQRLLAEDLGLGFDLETGPLLRVRLVRLAPQDWALLLTTHHIVSDGWSTGVFARELGACYEAFSEGLEPRLPELPVQYPDYAVWQRDRLRGERLEELVRYWSGQLAGAPPLLELPTDRPRPAVRTSRGESCRFFWPAAVAEPLKALAVEGGASLFMTLLAAFQALLARLSGQDDVAVGTFAGNRGRTELEGLIGFFINTLALRTDLSGEPSFRELLGRVREVTFGAYAHQEIPFEKLLEALSLPRDPSRTPIFQTMLVLHNFPQERMELSRITLEPLPYRSHRSNFDLTLWMEERNGGLACDAEHSTDLFDETTIVRMMAFLRRLIEGAVADPGASLWSLPLLGPEERAQVLTEWSRTVDEPAGEPLLHRLFEDQAARSPEAVAVETGVSGARLTYEELDARADRLARTLRALGVGPESRVGLAVERSPEMLVGMLGVLKAGGAYVPLDPTYPQDRLAFMLEDSGAGLLLTQERLAGRIPTGRARVILLDGEGPPVPDGAPEPFPVHPENAAYVIYTSGSTGRPKGVVVSHRSIAAYARTARDYYAVTPADRVLQFGSISFDTSAEEIYPTLIAGAALVLRSDEMALSMAHFLRETDRLGITLLALQTAFWHEIVAGLIAGLHVPRSLRLVAFGGEEALPDRLEAWRGLMEPHVRLVNTYGPTEATIVSTYRELAKPEADPVVPIGRAIPGARTYVLDHRFEPVPPGVKGELLIGGVGVARGYLGRPDLTAERFLPDPYSDVPGARLYRTGDLARYRPDGDLLFEGRADRQLKLRGYRIEPGEIEAALRRHPALHDAVVDLRGQGDDKRLVAWVVPREGRFVPEAPELRTFLREHLPEPMVPSAFLPLAALPLTPSGKVDRRALPEPAGTRAELPGYVEPGTALERTIAGIFRDLLRVNRVGLNDNFFELGGHSLLVVRAHQRLREALGREIPVVDLFRFPTVALLARHLGAREEEKPSFREVASLAGQQRAAQLRQKQALEKLTRAGRARR